MKKESDFGKGLVICLVKFAEHREAWIRDKQDYGEMRQKYPDLFTESEAVHKHFNAASDHLYEIGVPSEWQNTKLGKMVNELQDFCLEIGHGSRTEEKWTEDDVTKAYSMCREIALLIDKKLGLNPDIGTW